MKMTDLLSRAESELCHQFSGVPLAFRCPPGLPPVTVDLPLVMKAIRHLIDCSLDAPAPVETILVQAASGIDGPIISIAAGKSVHKNRWDTSSTLPGWDTDLRVAACRRILELHGTTLNLGIGQEGALCFWFALPGPASES